MFPLPRPSLTGRLPPFPAFVCPSPSASPPTFPSSWCGRFSPALLILTLAFAGGTLYLAERDISRLQCAPLSADGTIVLSVLDDAEVTLLPEARTDGIIVGQSAYRLLDLEAIFTEGRYIVQAQHISGQSLLISLSLSRPLALYCGSAVALVITDLFQTFYFVWHRKRLQKSVLAPIRDITDMAATLSANNLSNRINIAGTKNELKDLATVINSMLDRIEHPTTARSSSFPTLRNELSDADCRHSGVCEHVVPLGQERPGCAERGHQRHRAGDGKHEGACRKSAVPRAPRQKNADDGDGAV